MCLPYKAIAEGVVCLGSTACVTRILHMSQVCRACSQLCLANKMSLGIPRKLSARHSGRAWVPLAQVVLAARCSLMLSAVMLRAGAGVGQCGPGLSTLEVVDSRQTGKGVPRATERQDAGEVGAAGLLRYMRITCSSVFKRNCQLPACGHDVRWNDTRRSICNTHTRSKVHRA